MYASFWCAFISAIVARAGFGFGFGFGLGGGSDAGGPDFAPDRAGWLPSPAKSSWTAGLSEPGGLGIPPGCGTPVLWPDELPSSTRVRLGGAAPAELDVSSVRPSVVEPGRTTSLPLTGLISLILSRHFSGNIARLIGDTSSRMRFRQRIPILNTHWSSSLADQIP